MLSPTASFVNANISGAKPVHRVTISGYNRVFTTLPFVGSEFPWISKMGTLRMSANDKDGSSTLGGCDITVLDKGQLITQDFANSAMWTSGPPGIFNGRTITIKTGFQGLSEPDYLLRATLVIEKVVSSDDNLTYTFKTRDNSRLLKQYIYSTGDSGYPTTSTRPRTVGPINPMALLADICSNQCQPAVPVNAAAISNYQTSIFSGVQQAYLITRPEDAAQFVAAEIFKMYGGYYFFNSLGQLTPFFFIPFLGYTVAETLDRTGLVPIPVPSQDDVINQATVRIDYDGSNFAYQFLDIDTFSANAFGLYDAKTFEGRGERSFYGAWDWARLRDHVMFLRYGNYPLIFQVEVLWKQGVALELGDYVQLTTSLAPNRALGLMGLTNELCECLEVAVNFEKCTATLKLLDVNWLTELTRWQVAPDGTGTYPGSKNTNYMFICSNANGQYSNGDLGRLIY